MSLRKLILILVLYILGSTHSSRAQDFESTITLFSQTSDTVSIPFLQKTDIPYIALNHFLQALSLPFVVNDTTKKIDFLVGNYLIRFTENNPFVVITERHTDAVTSYQMQQRTLRKNGTFYVPLHELLAFMSKVKKYQFVYNDSKRTLSPYSEPSKYDILDLVVEQKSNGYLLTLVSTKRLVEVESWLKPDGWLFLTITNALADTFRLQKKALQPPLSKFFIFQSPTSVQLTMKVSPDVERAEVLQDPSTTNLLILLRTKAPTERPVQKPKKDLSKERERWKLDVIVLDPGHGGKDPGTIGVRGTYEKDITLSVALKLGELIRRHMPDIKVVYTRTTDTFVELYRRTQIANEAGGKLFISIHCNSTPRKPSPQNGFEIYLLRPGKTEEAIAIAAQENAVIQFEENYQERYRKLTEEEFIIITMAQSAYMKHSELYAAIATETVGSKLQTKCGVYQAGFYVLVGASMPNVLVELGYLSNKHEEEFLRSETGQRKIASALFESIKRYKQEYEETLTQ